MTVVGGGPDVSLSWDGARLVVSNQGSEPVSIKIHIELGHTITDASLCVPAEADQGFDVDAAPVMLDQQVV